MGQRVSSAPPKDIMMAVSSEHALREAELLTLRQIGDALNTVNRALEATNARLGNIEDHVSEARLKLSHIEGQNEARPDLRVEIERLKEDLQQRKGAGALLKWMRDYLPWLAGLGIAAATLSGKVHIG